jgi:hypothetical protein
MGQLYPGGDSSVDGSIRSDISGRLILLVKAIIIGGAL